MPENKKCNTEEIKRAAYIVGSAYRLAKMIRVHPNAVYTWISGKYTPDPIQCLKIQKATNGQVRAPDILPQYEWDVVI